MNCSLGFTLVVRTMLGFVPAESEDICDALRDLVLFVQFKKREKHPWRRVNFSKVPSTTTTTTTFTSTTTTTTFTVFF